MRAGIELVHSAKGIGSRLDDGIYAVAVGIPLRINREAAWQRLTPEVADS